MISYEFERYGIQCVKAATQRQVNQAIDDVRHEAWKYQPRLPATGEVELDLQVVSVHKWDKTAKLLRAVAFVRCYAREAYEGIPDTESWSDVKSLVAYEAYRPDEDPPLAMHVDADQSDVTDTPASHGWFE